MPFEELEVDNLFHVENTGKLVVIFMVYIYIRIGTNLHIDFYMLA